MTTPSEPDFWNNEADDDLPLHNENDAMVLAALETTRMAIARWTGGIHRPRMLQIGSLHVSPQARWYASACEGLEKWREDGGFAQDGHLDGQHHPVLGVSVDSEGVCMD